jgi:ubiquitin C-terminal hydrolase
MEALFREMAAAESRVLEGLLPHLADDYGHRTVVVGDIFGSLYRTRVRCVECAGVSDNLANESVVKLELRGSGHRSLKALWEEHFKQDRPRFTHCSRGSRVCKGGAFLQVFLEKEPPVLVIVLKRAWRDDQGVEHKEVRPVSFPERLEFMRTGPYRFCGVVRHHGLTCRQGHYVATCRLGEDQHGRVVYGVFDDASRVRRVHWGEVASEASSNTPYTTRPC